MFSYEEYLRVALIAAKEAGEDLQPRRMFAACRSAFYGINVVMNRILSGQDFCRRCDQG